MILYLFLIQMEVLLVNGRCANEYLCTHKVDKNLRDHTCFVYNIDIHNSSNCCCGGGICKLTSTWDALSIGTCEQIPLPQEVALGRNQGNNSL